jgi:eukaryotic-like serine/threonine-protein kinase
MALTSGTKLGPYEIQSPLGAGGMGEVYRARDTRLNRDVALKILPSEVAGDPDRRARFEREARTVAALSHPNIVALYEVGNADGVEYTVSELVDGETLRARMKQGPMRVREVVELAAQIADGMAAAHAAGIVHRDLKPENVMVTRDGRVKILDFGLARAMPTAASSGSNKVSNSGSNAETMALASSATMDYRTVPGVVMGTAAYMSPEQARGLEADYRADQFSFGLIVYEMLRGKQAFARDSAVETMAAIVRDEPEPLDGKIPAPLKWLVERCLEKDPARRFDSSRDLYQQLRTIRDHFSEAFTSSTLQEVSPEVAAAAHAGTKRHGLSLGTVVGLALLVAVIAAACAWWLHPASARLSDYKYTPFAVNASNPSWSPDGKMAAYSGVVGDDQQLFLRTLDSPTPRQLTQAAGSAQPLGWSPDSSHILYMQTATTGDSDRVFSIGTVGGDPDLLGTVPRLALSSYGNTLAISPDGKTGVLLHKGEDNLYDLYISDPIGSPLRRYPASLVSSKAIYNHPRLKFSPDGKQLLLIRAGDSGAEEFWLLPWPAGSGTSRRILTTFPHEQGTPPFDWMPDNRHIMAATTKGLGATRHLYLADTRSNDWQQITQGTGYEDTPSIAPDGSVLFAERNIDYDILSMSLADGTTQPLIVTARSENMPAWASKADSLVYCSDRLGTQDIWLHSKEGADRPLVTRASFSDPTKYIFAPVLSPDGTRVIFTRVVMNGAGSLWEVSVAGGAPVLLLNTSNSNKQQFAGDWSPDGSQFAFLSIEPDGKVFLNVVRTSGGAVAQKLGEAGYGLPSWSPDGKWISYSDDNDAWHLISPDGKEHRDLGTIKALNLGFSKDTKTAYGIRNNAGRWTLFSLDIETAKLRDIKELDSSLQPSSNLSPGVRFSLAPDGKSFAYAIVKTQSSLWMLQGYAGK